MSATTGPRLLVLLSGGLDSAVLLAESLNDASKVETVAVDYGQSLGTSPAGIARAALIVERLSHEAHHQ